MDDMIIGLLKKDRPDDSFESAEQGMVTRVDLIGPTRWILNIAVGVLKRDIEAKLNIWIFCI